MIRLNECRGKPASHTLLIAALSFAIAGCEAAAKDVTPVSAQYIQPATVSNEASTQNPRFAYRAAYGYDWHANGNRREASEVILAGAGRDDFNVPKFINGRGGYVCSVSGGGRRTKCYSK